MPRRGEFARAFTPPNPAPPALSRVGRREVTAPDSRGVPRTGAFDPAGFACSTLAAQLADEWVELAATDQLGHQSLVGYRQAITAFCTFVDETVPHPERASLAGTGPDLHHAVTEWVRVLPTRHAAGSRVPGAAAGRLRVLIARRAQHPDREVAALFDGWLRGAVGVRHGATCELDEFPRHTKAAMVRAAAADLRVIAGRLAAGQDLVAAGADPATDGWLEPANLAWAIWHGTATIREIAEQLPQVRDWPAALRRLLPADTPPRDARRGLLWSLVRSLYLDNLDLQSFRVLLMVATGRASEEVAGLTEADVEFEPDGVVLTFTKARARRVSRRAYSASPGGEGPVGPGRLGLAAIVRQLIAASTPLARRAGISPVPLFLRASLPGYELKFSPFQTHDERSGLRGWLARHDLAIEGPADIRRLRKSGKVEKAITYRGQVSDIADDHSVEVFRGHYAHGTTLRVLAGRVITTAQQRWFTEATDGPIVFDDHAEAALADPGAADVLGLSADQVEDLRTGALDMGVSSCTDPYSSPYGRAGQVCPVAPLRCLECPNALVLPSNLPQLLLFAQHLERLRLRLAPTEFQRLWGQSHTNLTTVLAERSDAEIARARQQITDERLALQLPLAAHVEFDT